MKFSPLQTGLIAGLTLASFSAFAGNVGTLTTFSSGSPAVAAEVNGNFTAVETAVNGNATDIAGKAAIGTNKTINQNEADITANALAINGKAAAGANKTINQNETDIAANALAINGKAAAGANKTINQNETDIAANALAINGKAAAGTNKTINQNETDIAANALAIIDKAAVGANKTIDQNETDITANTNAITGLQQNVNKSAIICAGNDGTDIMVRVGPLCVDKYEASVWSTALSGGTQYGGGATGVAIDDYPCADTGDDCTTIFARSQSGVTPSRFVTWFQAQQACGNSGKRLLTNAEWQMAVAGTPDTSVGANSDNGSTTCNTTNAAGVLNAGSRAACTSNRLVNGMIGNVYEMVADWLQGSGANASNVSNGLFLANTTVLITSDAYGDSEQSGMNTTPNTANAMPAMMLRGGSYASGNAGARAGAFAMRADFSPDDGGNDTIGFRCAR